MKRVVKIGDLKSIESNTGRISVRKKESPTVSVTASKYYYSRETYAGHVIRS